jgi:hypothetical protein
MTRYLLYISYIGTQFRYININSFVYLCYLSRVSYCNSWTCEPLKLGLHYLVRDMVRLLIVRVIQLCRLC